MGMAGVAETPPVKNNIGGEQMDAQQEIEELKKTIEKMQAELSLLKLYVTKNNEMAATVKDANMRLSDDVKLLLDRKIKEIQGDTIMYG